MRRWKNIQIQAESEPVPRDEAGQPMPKWITVHTCWAQILPATGKELYAGQQVNAELTHTVEMRYKEYPALTSAHRLLVDDERIFDINYVINVGERDLSFKLLCKEAV